MIRHKGTVQLETERLILRRFSREDAVPMYQNWASDPDVTKFLTWSAYTALETADEILTVWTKGYENDAFYQWAIVFTEHGEEPIGSISIVNMDDRAEKAEVVYCIGKSWWHKGIMSEALRAVMKFMFEEVGINRLESRHDTRNPHSGGVMIKCGMTYEGTTRQSEWSNMGIGDCAHYAILRSEYDKI